MLKEKKENHNQPTTIDTFYLHLEFKTKSKSWSINLPFLCTKCGICCTLNDFLTAGEINAKPEEQRKVQAKLKPIYDMLGKLLQVGEAEYDNYALNTPCPFLNNKLCTIYDIRPNGCRYFPNTLFGMQTQDCEALTLLKRQRAALKKGRTAKETYYFTSANQPIKTSIFTEEQYQKCLSKLHQTGTTKQQLTLFHQFNSKPNFHARKSLKCKRKMPIANKARKYRLKKPHMLSTAKSSNTK